MHVLQIATWKQKDEEGHYKQWVYKNDKKV